MKVKKEFIVLGLIVIALVAYLALRNTDRTHYRLPVLETIPGETIDKIAIRKADASIELNKTADKWTVSEAAYPADTGKIKQILDIIGRLTLTALVSESKSYDRYDLSEGKKIGVTAWAGDAVKREFEMGKAASSYKHTFVKIAGDHRVYHARESFRYTFDETVDDLRDKVVLDFEIKDIREIRVEKGEKIQHFARLEDTGKTDVGGDEEASAKEGQKPSSREPAWQRENGETISASEINRYLSNLDELACDTYIYDRKKEDLKNPVYTVRLGGTREYVLSIYASSGKAEKDGDKDANHPAVSSENPYPFELTAYRAGDIMKAFDKKEEKAAEDIPQKEIKAEQPE